MTVAPSPAPAPTAPRIELHLLGIGGAFDADRGVANTGALLQLHTAERTHRLLIDCGYTCGLQLHALGLGYEDIDAVLITHAHGDHIGGLETLGYKSLFLHRRACPLYAPQEVLDDIWATLAPKMGRLQVGLDTSQEATMRTYFDPRPVDGPLSFAGGQLTLCFRPVRHVHGMPAYGLTLQPQGDNAPLIRWSGDCVFDPGSWIFEGLDPQRGDLVFHDCLIYPYYEATVHTHLESLQTLPEATRRALVLIHHGTVEPHPALRHGMRLGQPLERFTI